MDQKKYLVIKQAVLKKIIMDNVELRITGSW